MGIGNRNNQHSFAQIPAVHQARSVFDRSHAIKDTARFDYLNPFMVEEILPGDTINLNVKSFFRLAPQVVPLMDNMYIDWFFFFVPNRLVWDNWEKFMGAQDNPGDSTSYLVPQVNLLTVPGDLSLFNHMGVPDEAIGSVSALPFRAYNLIWNDWFRDQNLQNSLSVPKTDGPDSNALYLLRKRAKKHDYFTSMLPWPQKGDPVYFPFPLSMDIVSNTIPPTWNGTSTVNAAMTTATSGDVNRAVRMTGDITGGQLIRFGAETGLVGDMTSVEVTMNQFRQAMMVQSLLELDARGGTRYIEILRAHFGVVSPDARLQRPEFLSSGTTFVNQHPVAQTSQTTTDSPQGNLASFSTAGERGNAIGFSKSFVEHGWVIGMWQARGDVTYQQGVNRKWTRRYRDEYFWPKLQQLGEQPVLGRELYIDGTAGDTETIGYQERYAEYRYAPSEVRGQFQSSHAETLDVWHLAQNFATRPTLNSAFIESNTPIQRNLVVPDADYPHLLCDFWLDMKHVRPMMVYGNPATLGRF